MTKNFLQEYSIGNQTSFGPLHFQHFWLFKYCLNQTIWSVSHQWLACPWRDDYFQTAYIVQILSHMGYSRIMRQRNSVKFSPLDFFLLFWFWHNGHFVFSNILKFLKVKFCAIFSVFWFRRHIFYGSNLFRKYSLLDLLRGKLIEVTF